MERLKVLLSGMVAGDPHQGGASWAVLQYLAGLRQLGHEVVLVEPLALRRGGGGDPLDEEGAIVRYFRSLPLIDEGAALLVQGTERTVGLSYVELSRFAAEADLLLNISGLLRDERLLESIPVRLFLDLDPGFNQVWQESGEEMGFDLHTHFVTAGQGVGRPGNQIPTCGRAWIHTLPPVVLDHWPVATDAPSRDAFTSVGHWRSYGSLEYEGVRYGQRAHSLRELIELPRLSPARFQLALGIHPDESRDLEALAANGWELVDPAEVAADPGAYAEFVRASKAEISIAKSGYVASRSGWFSDRSAAYLASGKPVVAQDTGFGEALPVGEGLLTFSSAEQAAAAVAEIEADPVRHRRAAREIAESHLDARKVLPHLLDRLQ